MAVLLVLIATVVLLHYRAVLLQRFHAWFKTSLWHAGTNFSPIQQYFVNAVTVYVWLGDRDAKLAALTAAHAADTPQRTSMRLYLGEMASALGQQMSVSENDLRYSARFRELERELEDHDWTAEDMREGRQRLLDRNPEYLHALTQADFAIFTRKYPDLFRALGVAV
jgi:hypothetical protein